MPILRRSDPVSVLCVWDAIQYINSHKLLADPQTLLKRLIIGNGYSQSEWEKDIKEVLADNLIEKSVLPNLKIYVYELPKGPVPRQDGRDWYCFECHRGGLVVFCKNKSCHRVFHTECVSKSALENYRLFKNFFTNSDSTVFLKKGLPHKRKSFCLDVDGLELVESVTNDVAPKHNYDNNLCLICNMAPLDTFSLERSELNYLLKFVLERIKAWIPSNVTHQIATGKNQENHELTSRTNYLFFEHKDMGGIGNNLFYEKYTNLHSFLADVLNVKHNIGIFHGVFSQEYAATAFLVRDTLHDLGEIIGCVDCYKNSNEKINENWFSLPCRIVHEIVWAKQKGFCYWPAKIIKKNDMYYDVRYFGGKHERALVNTQYVKPLTTPREKLKLKKSVALLKAIEQMEHHQKLLQAPVALRTSIATSTSKEISPTEQKPKIGRRSRKQKDSTVVKEVTSKISDGRPLSKEILKEDRATPEIGAIIDDVLMDQMTTLISAKGRQTPEIGARVDDVPAAKSISILSLKDLNLPKKTVRNAPSKRGRKRKSSSRDQQSPEIGAAVCDVPVKTRNNLRHTKGHSTGISATNDDLPTERSTTVLSMKGLKLPEMPVGKVPSKNEKTRKSSKQGQESTEIATVPSDVPTKRRMKLRSTKGQESPEVIPTMVEKPTTKNKGKYSKKGQESLEVIPIMVEKPTTKNKDKYSKKGTNKPKAVKKKCTEPVSDLTNESQETICISDEEDNVYTFSGNLTQSAMEYGETYEQLEQVTSSTECRPAETTVLNQEMQQLEHPFSDEVEMMRRSLERLSNKDDIIKCAVHNMQQEVDRLTEKYNAHLRQLFDSHNAQISDTKKKQWCYYCEQDAIYHCCWNTAYCSTTCQQQHWHEEHKKVCRRKKITNSF